jgi:hypothetical protein
MAKKTKKEDEQIKLNTETPIEMLMPQYCKNADGVIFHITKNEKNADFCFLRHKNNRQRYSMKVIDQGIVNKSWFYVNEHELRKHLKMEEDYFNVLSEKLLRRILMTQLLLELDDDLTKDYAGDKYMQNILLRSEKEFKRLLNDNYDKVFRMNQEVIQNMFKNIEGLVGKMAKLKLDDFYHVNQMFDLFIQDPEKFKADHVVMEKLDA